MSTEQFISNCGLCQMKKGIANILCNEKMYTQALRFYSEAIGLCPDSSVFVARSNCHMMLHEYAEALRDARTSVELEPACAEGHALMVKGALAMGDFKTARHHLLTLQDLQPVDSRATQEMTKARELYHMAEEAEKVFEREDYAAGVRHLDRVLERLPCRKMKLRRAECLALLGQYSTAHEVASNVLILDKRNEDALYVLAVCSYYQGRLEEATKRLQRLLRLSPGCERASTLLEKAAAMREKRVQAAKAAAGCRLRDAHHIYTEALKIDAKNKMANARTYVDRASISFKLAKYKAAIRDCSLALEMNSVFVEAYLLRAKVYEATMDYEKAVKDYERVCKMSGSAEHSQCRNDAKEALKHSRKKDHYQILGVPWHATAEEIKAAYKKKSLLHHPDRHMTAEREQRDREELMFKAVAQAYSVLSDPHARASYDRDQRNP